MSTPLPSASLGLALLLATASADGESVTLRHGDLRLNANLETTAGDWHEGPVVLMIHGRLAHARMEIMQGVQASLKERGVSSLAITLSLNVDSRQGMYPCATPHTHRHVDASDEIAAWLGWLQAKGVARVALLGHSSGGNQVARFAMARPDDPLSALILIAPQVWSADLAAQNYAKRYGKPLAGPLAEAQRFVADGRGGTMLEHVDFLHCEDAAVSAASFASYYAPDDRLDTPRLIPEIRIPILVVAGSNDDVMRGLVDTVKPLADGQRVQLKVIEGADHFFRDLYAEDVADAIQALLDGR